MRGSRQPRRIRPGILVWVGVLLALPLSAQEAGDPHLTALPRSPQELRRIEAVLGAPTNPGAAQPFERLSAGAATVRARSGDDALQQPAANLTAEQAMTHRLGRGLFERLWVSAPSSTIASDGLGPLVNAQSCAACHPGSGRGNPPGDGIEAVGLVLRLSLPGGAPHPVYGAQLQTGALPGQLPEGAIGVTWHDSVVTLADGAQVALRRPVWSVLDPSFGPLDAQFSARVAPPLLGLGLLDAIPGADLLALADPEDADGDGISGRAAQRPSPSLGGTLPGRFGHRAGEPTLRDQAASAFSLDLGLSSSPYPAAWGDCTETQVACRAGPHGDDAEHGGLEISDEALTLVTFFTATLGVPARRDVDSPEVLRGRAIFHLSGCADCHRPAHVTARLAGANDPRSFQLLWPYSDLLLHDLGEGLADAEGSEWRTAPLWGLGLTRQVNPAAGFLHDGRARTPLEAILWHGGEAQGARDTIAALPADDRAALITFLESL